MQNTDDIMILKLSEHLNFSRIFLQQKFTFNHFFSLNREYSKANKIRQTYMAASRNLILGRIVASLYAFFNQNWKNIIADHQALFWFCFMHQIKCLFVCIKSGGYTGRY